MQPGDLVGERFEIEGVAGHGGMGTVFRTRDRRTGARVAVKVILGRGAELAERFAREAAVLADLSHPGIVRFVASGATPAGEAYLVMEWMDGESLSERVARGTLSVAETIEVGRGVAAALAYAHARGVIHRDIKPSNLFLPGADLGRIKILDFGIARVVEGAQALTRTGQALGSPGFTSPEQAQGEHNLDPRSDIFSLACVLFDCLTGEPPFTGPPLQVLMKVIMEPAPLAGARRPDVPPALEALLQRMLAKEPAGRPADADAVAAELAALAPPPAAARTQAPLSRTTDIAPPLSARAAEAPTFSAPAPVVPPAPVHVRVTVGAPFVPPDAPPSVPAPPSTTRPVPVPPSLPAPAVSRMPAPPPPSFVTATLSSAPLPPPVAGSSASPERSKRPLVLVAVISVLATLGVVAAVLLFTGVDAEGERGLRLPSFSPRACAGLQHCVPYRAPDPAHVDPMDVVPAALKLAQTMDKGASFCEMTLANGVDGVLTGNGDVHAFNQPILQVRFATGKGNGAIMVTLLQGQLTAMEGGVCSHPLPLPTACPPKAAARAAVASGVPHGSVASLVYHDPGTGPTWEHIVNGRMDLMRRIDARSCTVTYKPPH